MVEIMIEDDITALVSSYYSNPHTGVLMLSNVGALLSKEDKWPPRDEDKRTLTEIAESTPGITLVRDVTAPSFIVVVPQGKEGLADEAIAQRKTRYFLRGLPRPVIVAFCLEVEEGKRVFLALNPRPIYYIGFVAPDAEHVEVDEDLRLPGLKVDELAALDGGDVAALEANIRAWCSRHEIPIAFLSGPRSREVTPKSPPAEKTPVSALERLYAAQSVEFAHRLIVPIDIALMLSRHP
jgi:hypothetical protein